MAPSCQSRIRVSALAVLVAGLGLACVQSGPPTPPPASPYIPWRTGDGGASGPSTAEPGGGQVPAAGGAPGAPADGSSQRPDDAGEPGSPRTPDSDDAATATRCRTGGSGGNASDVAHLSFAAGNGSRSEYHLYAADYSPGAGLLIFLHGDGGYSFDHPRWILEDIERIGAGHNLITLAVRTPGGDDTWWGDAPRNAAFLDELLREVVLRNYDLDVSRVALVGYSGGGDFFSSYFIPNHSDLFCAGGALVMGGGFPPYRSVRGEYAPEFLGSFRWHFYTGTNDPYLDDSQSGAEYYRGLGFQVTEDHPRGVGHEDIPFESVVSEQLPRFLSGS